jgi:hypothetical protein
MPDDNRLGRDLGWIIGLGVLAVIAGFLYDPGVDDQRVDIARMDPFAYLLDADSRYDCREGAGYTTD